MKTVFTATQEQGPRSYQEDYFVRLKIRDKKNIHVGDLMVVFDGHISKTVAQFCALHVGKFFKYLGPNKTEQALENLIAKLNSETITHHSGSTVSAALVLRKPLKVSVAVMGDSPVVIYDENQKLHMSPEHNVRSNPTEKKMAEKRGGYYAQGYLYADPVSVAGLQITRALGNSYLGNVLLREPEIYTIKNPRWILVSSDGIFDPGHKDTEKLLKELKRYADKRATAEELMTWANSRGLQDNATALVWSLDKK